jgi:hypothetical protein
MPTAPAVRSGSATLSSALLDVVGKLARGGLAHDYLGLRTLAVVGPPEISGMAAQAAEGIAAAERVDGAPAWAGQLGQVTPGACVVLADAYGETQTLLLENAGSYAAALARLGPPRSR